MNKNRMPALQDENGLIDKANKVTFALNEEVKNMIQERYNVRGV